MELDWRPTSSLDFNDHDRSFFIHVVQYKAAPRSVTELFDAVNNAFVAFQPMKINNNFITLQKCMEMFMEDTGM